MSLTRSLSLLIREQSRLAREMAKTLERLANEVEPLHPGAASNLTKAETLILTADAELTYAGDWLEDRAAREEKT
jgi:hypothetical protein